MKKEQYVEFKELTIAENLYSFVNKNLLPGTGISNSDFWDGFNKNIHKLATKILRNPLGNTLFRDAKTHHSKNIQNY